MSFKQGMSLVEIMIGLILLALIAIPSLNVINTKSKAVTATRDHSQAAFVAQRIQETARAYQFDLLEADQYSSDSQTRKKTFEWKANNDDEVRIQSLNGIDYKIKTLNVDPVVNKDDPDSEKFPVLYLIQFTIEYTGQDKKNHNLTINTAISRRD
jgi:Tfp pilus assembly protein PilE